MTKVEGKSNRFASSIARSMRLRGTMRVGWSKRKSSGSNPSAAGRSSA